MGWAKYLEDNIEKTNERKFVSGSHKQKTESETICSSVILLTKLDAEVEHKQQIYISEYDNVEYKDKYIVCKNCGKKVLFSAKSQKNFDAKGWDAPKRCKSCRNLKNTRYLMRSSF